MAALGNAIFKLKKYLGNSKHISTCIKALLPLLDMVSSSFISPFNLANPDRPLIDDRYVYSTVSVSKSTWCSNNCGLLCDLQFLKANALI